MDEAIVKRLFKICAGGEYKPEVMPMTISWLGNSSVATMPTLLDLLLKGKLEDHALASGDNIVLASVGAGMNINSVVYRLPLNICRARFAGGDYPQIPGLQQKCAGIHFKFGRGYYADRPEL